MWQLLMNESIDKNTVLFWDEPDESINPNNIPLIVDVIYELARHGVQIFITTHKYNLREYLQ
jgi:ABC-type multidrug transport system ATPase subunit